MASGADEAPEAPVAAIGTAPETLGAPLVSIDVLVIGSGTSGSAAALGAREAGAEVLVVELADTWGGNGGSIGQQFAAGTRWQEEAGVEDSVEDALAEWATLSGGRADDPAVEAFVRASAETLEWLESLGATITLSPAIEPGGGSVPRVHNVFFEPGTMPYQQAEAALGEMAWTSTRALSLVVRGRRVVGARVERGGETGWVEAGAVIVASGGFARNDELMVAARPALAARDFVYEAGVLTQGAGAHLVPDAGGAVQNLGNYGMYLHATVDPAIPGGRESIQLTGYERALIVDPEGRRVGDETTLGSFGSADAMLDAGSDRAFALLPTDAFGGVSGRRPGYNWSDPDVPEEADADALAEMGAAVALADLAEVASATGLPRDALEASFARYQDLALAGVDADFGKSAELLVPFSDEGIVVIELRPAAAKAFGGARTDERLRALDADGAVIPGLYVVGEAAGFLGTDAVGRGFTGSVTAAEWGGRLAGRLAAGE